MPNIIFNIPLYFAGITTCTYIYIYIYIHIYIYKTRTQAHTATASVAQSVERWSRDPGSRVQFPARRFGVAVFANGPG